jgi:DNA (cytosine-5)-methyltransferase 1
MIYLFELFAGYGGASFALKKANIPFECVGFSEIDKYAIKCFEQNHMYNKFINDSDEVIVTPRNYGDAREIDPTKLHDFDLLTAGFPCQAFSSAGKRLGEADSRGTLFNEIIRIAEVKKPKYMLLENVKGLLTKRFKSTFEKILSELNRIGYNVHWKVLNSKDFGIPQSRARVWFVCIRKDIDEPFKFQFPTPTELKIFIKDILEPTVDKKYYLSEKLQERFNKYLLDKKLTEIPLLSSPFGGFKSDEICGTLGAGCGVSASKTNYVLNEDKNEMKW